MRISIIAAIGSANELGYNGGMPDWKLPDDMGHFKTLTMEHPVIMGRITHDSVGYLRGRENVVITREGDNISPRNPKIKIAHSLADALAGVALSEEVFIIGGAQIYAHSIDLANRMYITHVDGNFVADTFFPEIEARKWRIIASVEHPRDERNSHNFRFVEYESR